MTNTELSARAYKLGQTDLVDKVQRTLHFQDGVCRGCLFEVGTRPSSCNVCRIFSLIAPYLRKNS